MNRHFIFKLLILHTLIILASCSPRYFVQISDPQLGFISKNKNVEKERELMEKIIPTMGHEPRIVNLPAAE